MSRRATAVLAALTVLSVVLTGYAGLAGGAQVRRDTVFDVVRPDDGATVPPQFELAWNRGLHDGAFAVIVDSPPPAPGKQVSPGPSVAISASTRLMLSLTPRVGGSPSARHWHEIIVVPVDKAGRRVGEQQAIVHVRGTA